MKYVTDTHPLFWFLLNKGQLSEKARDIFEETERGEATIIIPSIVLLEMMRLLEKIGAMDYFSQTLEELEKVGNYKIFNLGLNVVKKVAGIKTIGELHDTIIVAIVKILGCPIITKDKDIINSEEIECIR